MLFVKGEINTSVQKIYFDDYGVCNFDVWLDVPEYLSAWPCAV
jgi:hypothetical protein